MFRHYITETVDWALKKQLPAYLPTYLPTYQPTYLPTYLPTNLPTCLPTNLPTYLPACLSTYLPIYLPTYLPTHLPTYPHIYLPTCLPTYLTEPSSDSVQCWDLDMCWLSGGQVDYVWAWQRSRLYRSWLSSGKRSEFPTGIHVHKIPQTSKIFEYAW